MDTALGIPYKTEARKERSAFCFCSQGFFSVYMVQIGKRPVCFSSVVCLVEGSEDGGCFVFLGVGLPGQRRNIWGKCCFCFSLISVIGLLLTYLDTRPQMCIR